MDNKILSFLEAAGYAVGEEGSPVLQLIRYFEDEFGINIMPFLEQEWLDEQLESPSMEASLATIRGFVDEQFQDAFDDRLDQFNW